MSKLDSSQKTLNPINKDFLGDKNNAYCRTKFFEITGRTELLEWVFDNRTISLFEKTQHERDEKRTFHDDNGILRYEKNWLPATDGVISSYDNIYFETGCGELSFLTKVSNLNGNFECRDNIATLKILLDWERLWWLFATDSSDELANHGFLLRATLGSFIYWILRRLYIGMNDGIKENAGAEEALLQQQQQQQHQSERFYSHAAPTLHWRGAVRRYLVLMYSELVILFTRNPCARISSSRRKYLKRQIVTSFDQLLNIALKYVTHHCGVSARDVNLNRRGYKLAFLSLFTVLPVFCLLSMVREWLVAIDICNEQGQSSVSCQNIIILTVLQLGSLTTAVSSYLLFGTLIVSIIGLIYGTELAYHLTNHWIRRFVGLRKVSVQSVEDHNGVSRLEVSAVHQSASSAVESLEDGPASTSASSGEERLSLQDVANYLKTDAVEQYLFLVEYMRQCGVTWSAVIVGLYIYATVMGLVSGYYITSYVLYPSPPSFGNVFQHTMFLLPLIFQCLLFFIFPALSLAHANSLIIPLLEVFSNSSRDDFMIIGGKDMWLEFVNSLPAAWTVCGVWITYNRIIGFISTALTAAGTALITYLLSGTIG
eukprot:gene23748-32132_t